MIRTALPVAVEVTDSDLAHEVVRFVESTLGWIVVDDGPDLPVRLRITDDASRCRGAVLVGRSVTAHQAGHAIRAGALEVLAWPTDADRLATVDPKAGSRVGGAVVTVGGSAAGVGTTTIALAIAAASAWAGRPTVLVADQDGRDLAGITPQQPPVVTCPGLPALRMAIHVRDVAAELGRDDLVVVDVGVSPGAHVLVARPDRHLLAALAARPSEVAPLVTIGEGPLRPFEVGRAVRTAPHVHLEWSFRVARAGLRGNLPGAFPGRLLRALSPFVTDRRSSRAAA